MSTSFADRAVLAVAAAVALVAVVTRVHDVVAFPALRDFDASGHAVNVIDLLEGHLPDPRSWCGSHPPLYYALGALLWRLGPDGVPVHVTLRLLAAGAWLTTVGLAWGWLRRRDEVDAAVAAVLLLGMPGLVITSVMMTNDALCALFVTAMLIRLLDTPRTGMPSAGDAAWTGVLAGLAALTKATGMAAVGIGGAFYAWRVRHDPKRAAAVVLAFGAASAAVAGLHYVHLFLSVQGSPYDIMAARAGSQEKEVIATVVDAITGASAYVSSPLSLFAASLWGDPTAVYLPHEVETHLLARLVTAGGVLVTVVALAGVARLCVRPELVLRAGSALLFGAAYAAALLPHAIDRPYIVLTKTNYLMLEALPVGIVLVAGLGWLGGRARTVLRLALLAVAVGGVGLTTYGWWQETPSAGPPLASLPRASSAPAAAVRYFAARAGDPIRAAALLTPAAHLAHDLRLVRIVGLPPLAPEPGYGPEAERALELARARVAWLELYNLIDWMRPAAAALTIEVQEAVEHGDTADVQVRVGGGASGLPTGVEIGLWPFPPFTQRFGLERRDGAWRVAAIAQEGVIAENALQAFVAAPTLAGFDRLRALGWRPPWRAAIEAVGAAAR